MSAEASTYVWRHSPYTGTKFVIHLAIGDVVNDTNDNLLWMATDTIAQKTRANRRTVQRVIDEMVADGFLEPVKAATQHRPAVYRFIHKLMPTVWGDELRGDISSLRGDISSLRGGESPPELNITKEEPKHSSSSVDDGFTEFWAMYPRKIGKGAARTAYRRALKKTEHPNILTALHLYNLTRPQDPQYIPHPSTWLNQERWADETENLHPTNKPDPQPQWQPCGNCWNGWIELDDQTLAPCTCRKGQP
jgi:hypothetical protein